MHRGFTGFFLPPENSDINIFGLELNPIGPAPSPLSRKEGRARAHEGIEDQRFLFRYVKDRVSD